MTETHSKSRQQAEIAFGATQSQFFAKSHAAEELISIAQAREEKTLRLREARLDKELPLACRKACPKAHENALTYQARQTNWIRD